MTVKEFINILDDMDPTAIVNARYEEYVEYSELTSASESVYGELPPEAVFEIEQSDGEKHLIIAADLMIKD